MHCIGEYQIAVSSANPQKGTFSSFFKVALVLAVLDAIICWDLPKRYPATSVSFIILLYLGVPWLILHFARLFSIYLASTSKGYSIHLPPVAQYHIHPLGTHIQKLVGLHECLESIRTILNILAQLWRIIVVLLLRRRVRLAIQWIGAKHTNTTVLSKSTSVRRCQVRPRDGQQPVYLRLSFTHRGCLRHISHMEGRPPVKRPSDGNEGPPY